MVHVRHHLFTESVSIALCRILSLLIHRTFPIFYVSTHFFNEQIENVHKKKWMENHHFKKQCIAKDYMSQK